MWSSGVVGPEQGKIKQASEYTYSEVVMIALNDDVNIFFRNT